MTKIPLLKVRSVTAATVDDQLCVGRVPPDEGVDLQRQYLPLRLTTWVDVPADELRFQGVRFDNQNARLRAAR